MFKKLTEIRNNLLISRRLKGLVLIIAIFIIVLGIVSVRSVTSINSKINEVSEQYFKSLVKLSGLVENIYSLLIESHIISEKSLSDNAIDNSLNIDLLNTYLIEYEQSIIDEEQRSIYDGFLLELQNYLGILKELNALEIQGKYQLSEEIKSTREITSFKKLQTFIKSMIAYNTKGIQNSYKLINDLEQKSVNTILISSLFILLLSISIVLFLIQDISNSLKALNRNLSILQEGEIPETNLAETKNELGQMSGLTNILTTNLAKLNHFAIDISKGNYSTEYQFAGKNDLLGKALVNLRNNLRISREDDEKRKLEEERRNWTNKGHAIFSEILRQRSREVNILTDDIIKNLVYYLKANQGGLFLINDTTDISRIELISAFAYDRKKFFERIINIGDGLIGTVALERNTVYLKEIPEDYIEIESGLGDAKPKCLLIVPLKFEEDILGIVEIASFKEFQDFEIKFVEEVAQSIASTLLTAKINARTQQLLDESRKQSEILAAQEIEARQNMEEMRATQELAKRREADLSGIISAVDNTLMKGEYEIDGTLISVNNRHLQTLGYQLKEIKGKNIEMFIPEDELEHFRKVWANVVAGNPRQLEVKRRTKTGEELWLINQYTPVNDITGKISKVLYFAHDITKYKKSEEEIVKKSNLSSLDNVELLKSIELLKESENELNFKQRTFNNILNFVESDLVNFELDMEGLILKVNQKFHDLFHISFSQISGKKLSEVVQINEYETSIYSNLDQIRVVKSMNMVNCYQLIDGSAIWLHEFYSVIYSLENIPAKISVIGYDITRQKIAEQQNERLLKEVESISDVLLKKDLESKKSIEEKLNENAYKDLNIEENQNILNAFNHTFARIEVDYNYHLIFANKEFSERYKYSERELRDKSVLKLITTESKGQFEKNLENSKDGEIIQIQSEIITKDKEIVKVSLYFIPFQKDKQNAKIIIFILENIVNQYINNQDPDLEIDIQKKKYELHELEHRIENLKNKDSKITENESFANYEIDELYNSWLNKIKKSNT